MISASIARRALIDMHEAASMSISITPVAAFKIVSEFIDEAEQLINAQKSKTPALLREIENVYE